MRSSLSPMEQRILDYTLPRTDPETYLLAALSSHQTSPYILATDRAVLTFGGFNGGDNVVSVDQLAAMVESGELRYVLGGEELALRKPEIGLWVRSQCTEVLSPRSGVRLSREDQSAQAPLGPGPDATVLYDCGI